MAEIAFAIFLVLHGLVHLLYLGQSRGFFELQPGMGWPAGSWAFSALLGNERVSWLAAGACLLLAAGFVAGGVGLLAGQGWWRPLVLAVSLLSILIFILLWDGRLHALDDQGAVNLLINAAILLLLLGLRWPIPE